MDDVFICDAVRTPIGRFGGSLAKVRADDLAAAPIKALMARHPKLDWSQVDEVYFGCANQAGEDNRNVGFRAQPSIASAPRGSMPLAPRVARSAPARSISPSPAASNR
jgi:acetyl-CoA acetyltransferase